MPNDELNNLVAMLQSQVADEVYPRRFRAGDGVGGLSDPGIMVRDTRDNSTLTGRYPRVITQDVIAAARQHHVDPNLALAMALQETSLGKGSGQSNPLHENNAPIRGPLTEEMLRIQHNAYLTDPAAHGDGAVVPHSAASNYAMRADALDTAFNHLKQLQRQQATAPEAHQIQAYNGLGKLRPPPRPNPNGNGYLPPDNFYGMPVRDLPQDFYGKRIQDIRDNVVAKDPQLQQLVQRLMNPR